RLSAAAPPPMAASGRGTASCTTAICRTGSRPSPDRTPARYASDCDGSPTGPSACCHPACAAASSAWWPRRSRSARWPCCTTATRVGGAVVPVAHRAGSGADAADDGAPRRRRLPPAPVTGPAGDVVGLVLAAGRGSRMSPITDSTPKPLLTVDNHRLLDLAIRR